MENPFATVMTKDSQSLDENPFNAMTSLTTPTASTAEENPFSIMGSNKILPTAAPITQPFGNKNPSVEVMSGGTNYGTDLGASEGTPVSLPPGVWEIKESFSGDTTPGHIGDSTNRGYGNSVLAVNAQTGEKLRLSHLSENYMRPGQIIQGGVIGKTGMTGNVTGPHLDLEYYNQQGQLQDVLQSPYAKYLQ